MRAGLLSRLPDDDAAALRAVGATRRYRRGDTLFHAGDDPGGVHLLVRGHLKVVQSTRDGREVILAFPAPGDPVGELAAVSDLPRSATVRALDAVETLFVARRDFRALVERRPRVALALLEVVAERLQDTDDQRVDQAAHDVLGRLVHLLVHLCDRFGERRDGAVVVAVGLTQDELAASTAASREAVAKAMALLRRLGWIETRRRAVVVRDLDALRRYGA